MFIPALIGENAVESETHKILPTYHLYFDLPSVLCRWFVQIKHNFPVTTCAEILLLVAITIARKLAMPVITHQSSIHEECHVKLVHFTAKRYNFFYIVLLLHHFVFISLLLKYFAFFEKHHMELHLCSGTDACVLTSLSTALPPCRMPPVQSALKTCMPLWCNGACL